MERSALPLPAPRLVGEVPVETVIHRRRSVRHFQPDPIPLADVGQLLWAGQGVTHAKGYRTAPSAGAICPLVVYLLAGGVAGLAPGLYRYLPQTHGLEPLAGEDLRERVFEAALRQSAIRKAPAVLLLSAAWESMTSRYGRRGIRYVYMEAGHAAQNVTLQAVALGLGSVVIGAFEDERLLDSLSIPRAEHPLYLIPVGRC